MQNEFDVIIFGATGFTGSLATRYLSRHYPQLRLALAARNKDKLQQLAQSCEHPPAIIIADASQPQAIQAMVKRTHVLANFAGPFALYGESVVAACAQHGRHYCDITGETPWIKQMISRYEGLALQSRACLVPFAGFDSVPADLLTYIALREAKQRKQSLDQCTHYYDMRGGFNGGTLATALTLAEQGQTADMMNTNLLIPDPNWPQNTKPSMSPSYAPLIDRWTVPFFMNPINCAVVRRSAYLRQHAGDSAAACSYEERMVLASGLTGRVLSQLANLSIASFSSISKTNMGRQILRKLGPKPGEGPSESVRTHGYYRGQLIGQSHGQAKIHITMDGKGDPGNHLTVMFAAEIAKLLSEDAQGPQCKGFTTPSVAFAEALIGRLKAAGIRFDIRYLES